MNYLVVIYHEAEICQQNSEAGGGEPCIVKNSATICKLVDLIPVLHHQSDCRIPDVVSAKTVQSCSINQGPTIARFQPFFR